MATSCRPPSFWNYGSRIRVDELATDFNIGKGTVILYTKRVITALVSLAPEWIKWPDKHRREELGQAMRKEGFPGCVGFVDGTTIPLAQKPALHGARYNDWKKRYSINMQVVCDVDGRITAMHAKCPGSMADSSVHRRMELYTDPKLYFSPVEYLIADSAYALSKHCIPAYKSPAADRPDNAAFNYCVTRSCIRNEHCIGVLKSRWGSLREMREQIRNDRDMEILLNWILACCVLHNMLVSIGDAWEDIYDDGSGAMPSVSDELIQTTIESTTFRETLKTTLETNFEKGVLAKLY